MANRYDDQYGGPGGGPKYRPKYRLNKQPSDVAPAPVSVAGVRDAVAPTAGGTKPNYISLTKDIAKQKKLAAALSAIGNTQYDDQEYGGIVVPRSPLSLLTSAAGNFGGAYLDAEADTKEAKLKAEKTAAALAQYKDIFRKTEQPINEDDVEFDLDQQTTIIPKSSGRFASTYTPEEQREMLVQMRLGADDNEYAQQYADLGLENVDYATGRRDVADQAAAGGATAAEGKRRFDATAAALLDQNTIENYLNKRRIDLAEAESSAKNAPPGTGRGKSENVLNAVNNLINNPMYDENGVLLLNESGKQINRGPLLTDFNTGVLGQTTQFVGGTESFKIRALLDTIKSNLGFDELEAMRNASKTGGALGNITVREIELLQNTIANLDIGLDKQTLIANIKAIEKHYITIQNNLEQIEMQSLLEKDGK